MTYKGNDTFRVAICGNEPGSEEMEAVRAGEKKHLKMFPRPVPPPDCCQFGQWEVEALLDSELAIDLH